MLLHTPYSQMETDLGLVCAQKWKRGTVGKFVKKVTENIFITRCVEDIPRSSLERRNTLGGKMRSYVFGSSAGMI